ncbi:hypothetical protein MMC20_001230 [Loxospora ochrophaea]|nr:hypothetical protein [Loxospora ochrophaea]
MAPAASKKRKLGADTSKPHSHKKKKTRKLQTYSSASSEAEDFPAVDLASSSPSPSLTPESTSSTHNTAQATKITSPSRSPSPLSSNSGSDSEASQSSTSSNPRSSQRPTSKRHDPAAFSTSIQRILASKLSTSKRSDPVLSLSKDAQQASHELANSRLETKAKHKLREEKRQELDRGRIEDVLIGSVVGSKGDENGDTGEGANGSAAMVAEQEKRLRKTAQRGVVKLFNAVRAAQVKGEEAAREARKKGVVGAGRREEKVTEMSKKGFLDLIAGGGNGRVGTIEEA